tara:strand:- start:1041 stop:1298 length:258 start_codon:yes stop_codon:yes gene_type:complete
MIDTDAYERILKEEYEEEGINNVLAFDLLAEVKRLLEENTYLNHMLDGVDKHTLDHVAEQAQIKMHEAGECYDFCIVCETEGEEE